MNVVIDDQLKKDALEIEKSIQYLRSQITYVINQYSNSSDVNQKEILKKYADDLKTIRTTLVQAVIQQKEMEKLFNDAAKEIDEIENYNKKLVSEHELDPAILEK